MKKKVVIGIVLAVFLLLALASPVLAAVPTVSALNPNTGNVGTAPEVTITGTGFVDGQTTVNVSGAAGVSAGVVTFVNSTSIKSTFTIAADAAAGARDVTVTTSGGTSTPAVTFTVNAYITVVAPNSADKTLGYMTAGQTRTATITGGTVASNYITAWQVIAKDEKVNNPGFMNTNVGGTGTVLANNFQISMTGVNTDLVNSITGITYPPKPTTLPFYISQLVAANADPGSYQITITFTGSGS